MKSLKFTKVCLCTLLCLTLLSGCGDNTKNEENNKIEENNKKVENNIVDSKVVKQEVDGLNEVLVSIKNINPGSAGCSLREVIASVKLMQWTNDRTITDDMVKSTIDEYQKQLSNDDEASLFKECINNVISSSNDLVDNWQDRKDLLDSAGLLDVYNTFKPDKDKITKVLDIFQSFAK